MTHITIESTKITISGHSGYDVYGKDIVCAAISTLSESTYRYLKATGNRVRSKAKDGYYEIDLKSITKVGKQIISEFVIMINELIEEYGKYIEMEIRK